MKKADHQYFENTLVKQRKQVVEHVRMHGGAVTPGENRQDGSDLFEESQQKADIAIIDRLAGSEDLLLEKIDLALARLKAGTYGLCTGCAKKIPLARLRAKPSASLCVKCQEAKEQKAG